MGFADRIAALFWEFHLAITRRIEAELRRFAAATERFIYQLLQERVPPDWRERLTAHLAHWEHEGPGFIVHNREVLERYIVDWAKAQGIAVSDDPSGTHHDSTPNVNPRDAPPHQSPLSTSGREFYDQKLAEAQSQLDEMRRRLEALGAKLDAATLDESVDIENEVDEFESLIWRYNDAIESARDTWLRDNLSGDDNTRLLNLLTPVSLGLPYFVDAHQMERANRQASAVSRRLGQRDVALHRMQLAAKTADWISFSTGMASGAGFVWTAAKRGGRWAIVKAVAAVGAAVAAEQGVESAIRSAGGGETAVRGARLAAMIVAFILLRRANRRASKSADFRPNPSPTRQPKPLPPAGKRARSPGEGKRQAGLAFDKAQESKYQYNQVPIAKPSGGKPYVLDSYDLTRGEIISRKNTQLSEIHPRSAIGYLRELANKYPPGSMIADVPSAGRLAGQRLKGRMFLEVPPQWKKIPTTILDEAKRLDITIRDSNGRIYDGD